MCSAATREVTWQEEITGVLSLPFYSKEVCQEIMQFACEADAWVVAPVAQSEADGTYSTVAAPRTRSAEGFSPNEQSPVRQLFDEKMIGEVIPLVNKVWNTSLQRHASTHLVRYKPGDFYLPHTDDFPDPNYRYFTALCYLNDNFTGGETTFLNLNYSAKPIQGKMIIFPSSYLHCSNPVTAGEKHVIVSWLVGGPPRTWL